ncbi:alpha/beta hydrolase [Thermomonas aquatica]|uniref:Alpha/beta fold hydrolase n=1 Tax=Thermomonas aquatica TaxID=2202149 RepID=A0A5B7ZUA9_9GAMM|nr:alpha/beta fold hydrolase [Thermomonas aquatica]QDA57392.1 alpha/beta fold hydrolase [Thermomonas aquatica]
MTTAPAVDSPLFLPGPAGRIEAALDPPEADVEARPLLAIVCHPLPTEGGTMHNKVVTMAARALRECGATTLRFNFRGAGQSEGRFDDGDGELDDLRAVAAWARERHPGKAVWLAGFSFGAYVSLRLAVELRAAALISIAPPVGRSWDFSAIAVPTMPWLVIQGDADEIVDPQAVYAWIAALPRQPQLLRMPDTSHFFHRKLMDLRGALRHGVRDWLPAA